MANAPFGVLADRADGLLGISSWECSVAFLFELSAIPIVAGAPNLPIAPASASEYFLLFKICSKQFLSLRTFECFSRGRLLAVGEVFKQNKKGTGF